MIVIGKEVCNGGNNESNSQNLIQIHSLEGNSNTNCGNLTSSTMSLSTTFNTKASAFSNILKSNNTNSCSNL